MNTDQIHFAYAFLHTEPQAAARLLQLQSAEEVVIFLTKAPHHYAKQILEEMLPVNAAAILGLLPTENAIGFMVEMSHAGAAAILRVMDSAAGEKILAGLPVNDKTACRLLLNYPADAIGAWIETRVTAGFESDTAGELILDLKKKGRHDSSRQIYVVSHRRRLVGTLAFVELLRAQNQVKIGSIMNKKFASLSGATRLASALRSTIWNQLDHVAVVNRSGVLIGELSHCLLRRATAVEQKNAPVSGGGVSSALTQAYADSLWEVFDTLKGSACGPSSRN